MRTVIQKGSIASFRARSAAPEGGARKKTERSEEERARMRAGRKKALRRALAVSPLFVVGVASAAVLSTFKYVWVSDLAKPAIWLSGGWLLALYVLQCAALCALFYRYVSVGGRKITRFEFCFSVFLHLLGLFFFFGLAAMFATLVAFLLLFVHDFMLAAKTRRRLGRIWWLYLLPLCWEIYLILVNYLILLLN